MSVDAGIDFLFKSAITPSALVKALLGTGWGPDPEGEMSLYPPADPAQAPWDNDWQKVKGGDISYLVTWVARLDEPSGEFGFDLFHRETGICGPFLISDDRHSLRWATHANIPYIVSHRNMVDFSKCMSVIFPAIKSAGLAIKRIEMYAQ